MNICAHGRPQGTCPLCHSVGTIGDTLPQDILKNTAALQQTPIATPVVPELTDPEAKDLVRLAEECAKAKEAVAVNKNAIKEYERQLQECKEKLEKAESEYAEKKKALLESVTK